MIRQQIEQYFWMAFLFLLPWQTRLMITSGSLRGTYWEYGTISLYIVDLILIIAIILSWRQLDWKKIFSQAKQNLFTIALIGGLLIVNTVCSLSSGLTLYHIVWLILAGIAYICISRFEKIKMAGSVIVGAAAASALGAWQFIAQSTFASKWLGLAEHDPATLGVSVVEAVAPDGLLERWLRAYGPLDHPNMLGGLAAVSLIVVIHVMHRHYESLSSKFKITLYISTIILSLGLIISFSRSAWLAFAAGIIVYSLSVGKSKLAHYVKNVWPLAGIGAAILILFLIPYYYLFTPRFTFNTRLENKSIVERVSGAGEAWQLIEQRPIIGSGIGTFGLALIKQWPDQIVWFYQPVHNVFLLAGVEIGLIGVLILFYLIFRLARIIWQSSQRSQGLSLLAALLVIMFFDHWLFSLHFGVLFAFSVLALIKKN